MSNDRRNPYNRPCRLTGVNELAQCLKTKGGEGDSSYPHIANLQFETSHHEGEKKGSSQGRIGGRKKQKGKTHER